jgi:hypothetical protein
MTRALSLQCEHWYTSQHRALTSYNTQITRMESDCDPVFTISPMSGTEVQDETVTTVTYTPKSNGQHSVDHHQFNDLSVV